MFDRVPPREQLVVAPRGAQSYPGEAGALGCADHVATEQPRRDAAEQRVDGYRVAPEPKPGRAAFSAQPSAPPQSRRNGRGVTFSDT